MADLIWAKRLARIRGAKSLEQSDLAKQFETSQTEVSRWERGKKEIPQNVRVYIAKEEKKLGISPEDPLPSAGVTSRDYSFTQTTFNRLWEDSPKRIDQLEVEADVWPSDDPRFADAVLRLRFHGVELPLGDPLYMDCLGVSAPLWRAAAGTSVTLEALGGDNPSRKEISTDTDDLFCFQRKEGSELFWGFSRAKDARHSADREPVLSKPKYGGTLSARPDVQLELGPHTCGYELRDVSKSEEITTTIYCVRGVRADRLDGIGAPVYADAPVRSLSLSVTFHDGLLPDPEPTDANVYLLRRTLVESRPASLAGGLKVSVTKSKRKFAFQNLQRPRVGFGYCLAWGSLVKS
jgi:transcriptional regulator with XRE-family HTH domain